MRQWCLGANAGFASSTPTWEVFLKHPESLSEAVAHSWLPRVPTPGWVYLQPRPLPKVAQGQSVLLPGGGNGNVTPGGSRQTHPGHAAPRGATDPGFNRQCHEKEDEGSGSRWTRRLQRRPPEAGWPSFASRFWTSNEKKTSWTSGAI